ncbi:MAG: hypothetical protein JOZ64_18720 [Solirubrobacterales bacterium]|nr:hypothetical protein [Solirubrobacterales bacterium]
MSASGIPSRIVPSTIERAAPVSGPAASTIERAAAASGPTAKRQARAFEVDDLERDRRPPSDRVGLGQRREREQESAP